jgi:hypothetical protein
VLKITSPNVYHTASTVKNIRHEFEINIPSLVLIWECIRLQIWATLFDAFQLPDEEGLNKPGWMLQVHFVILQMSMKKNVKKKSLLSFFTFGFVPPPEQNSYLSDICLNEWN